MSDEFGFMKNPRISTVDMAYEQWLEKRKGSLGGSDAGAVMGFVEWLSPDETYNNLIAQLREAQKSLTAKIEPKVYEYGFLME